MESQVQFEAMDDLVEIRVSGKLTREIYEEFVPLLEERIREHGKLRVLFIMEDFHGWTAGALWDDIKFDVKHFRDIARVAIVGEKKWQHGMSVFCKPFTAAKLEYFPMPELERAREWLGEVTAKS